MKCPMTFGNPCADRDEECRPDCAWLLEKTGKDGKAVLMCAIAMIGRRQMRDGRGIYGRGKGMPSYAPYAVNVMGGDAS